MFKRVVLIFGFAFLAFLVFIISVYKTVGAKYVFTQSPSPSPSNSGPIEISYMMPYPGRIAPDNTLWPLKALRDRAFLTATFKEEKKASLLLLYANKRIQMAKRLFEDDKADLAVSTMTKAEKYLEEAVEMQKKAVEKKEFTATALGNIALSSLKHRQILEEILVVAPEDAKPAVVKDLNYPKRLFEDSKNMMIDAGHTPPNNPYEGQ